MRHFNGVTSFAQPLGQKSRGLFFVFDQENAHHEDFGRLKSKKGHIGIQLLEFRPIFSIAQYLMWKGATEAKRSHARRNVGAASWHAVTSAKEAVPVAVLMWERPSRRDSAQEVRGTKAAPTSRPFKVDETSSSLRRTARPIREPRRVLIFRAGYLPKTFLTSPTFLSTFPAAFSPVPRSSMSGLPVALPAFSFTFPFAS